MRERRQRLDLSQSQASQQHKVRAGGIVLFHVRFHSAQASRSEFTHLLCVCLVVIETVCFSRAGRINTYYLISIFALARFVVSGLTTGETYVFRVQAINELGLSDESQESSPVSVKAALSQYFLMSLLVIIVVAPLCLFHTMPLCY